MKKTRIVFFDIDHTIYDPVKKRIPTSTIEAIKKLAQKKDTYVAIATGRAYYMCDILAPIKPFIDIYITINGQIIIKDDKTLIDYPLDQEIIQDIKTVFNHYNLTFGFIGANTQAVNRLNALEHRMFLEASLPVPMVDPQFDLNNKVYQMWGFASDLELKAIKKALKGHQIVPWLSDGFDIVHTDKSKRDGIDYVLNYLTIEKEHALCFGDGDNDIEMLTHLPNSIAMGNAKDHVKQYAKHVTSRYDEDGIYDALKALKWID